MSEFRIHNIDVEYKPSTAFYRADKDGGPAQLLFNSTVCQQRYSTIVNILTYSKWNDQMKKVMFIEMFIRALTKSINEEHKQRA